MCRTAQWPSRRSLLSLQNVRCEQETLLWIRRWIREVMGCARSSMHSHVAPLNGRRFLGLSDAVFGAIPRTANADTVGCRHRRRCQWRLDGFFHSCLLLAIASVWSSIADCTSPLPPLSDFFAAWQACGGGAHFASLWHLPSLSVTATMPTAGFTQAITFAHGRVLSCGNERVVYHWSPQGKLLSTVPSSSKSLFSIAVQRTAEKNDGLMALTGNSSTVDLFITPELLAASLEFC